LERIDVLRDTDFFWTMRWIRADAIGVLVVTLWAVTVTHGSWACFFALLLVPDLSMAGYLFGSRAGAAVYNTGHMYAWPLALLAVGLTSKGRLTTTAGFSWIAHIAVDQVVGYGLKLPTMFEHTVLGPIGRARRVPQVVERAATPANRS
jgi:uncharacterized protein DUF4260